MYSIIFTNHRQYVSTVTQMKFMYLPRVVPLWVVVASRRAEDYPEQGDW